MNPTQKPNMTLGRAALLGLMKRYLVGLMDDAVTLLEIQKLMYFMQEAGQPLKLKYVKGFYGPYAENLSHVLERIEGHYIVGFGDGSEEPGKVINTMPDATRQAETFLEKEHKAHDRFHRVESLIDGFETAYGLELLASVHWVAKHEASPATTYEEAIQRVHDWNPRKRETFAPKHIQVAWERLAQQNWL